jgi:hypothetical protein
VLWLPDLYILDLGQPGRAVAVLMCMHLAIALVTYNCLVHIAPVKAAGRPDHRARRPAAGPAATDDPENTGPGRIAGHRR